MSLQLGEYPVNDFSGGITDYTLAAQPNQAELLTNFIINPNKKLETAPGSIVFDSAMYQVPDGNVRVTSLYTTALPDLLIGSARKLWRPNTSSFQELTGPSGNPAFSSGTTANYNCFAEWNDHILATNDDFSSPIKIYRDGSNVYQTRTSGLPDLATAPTVTKSGGTGNNYIYAFIYYYTYTVGTTVFEDYGPTTLVSLTNSGTPDVNNVAVAAIPVLANGTTLNYDTSNVKVYVYRTIAGGSVLYKVGQVTNGTTTFTDNVSDTTAQTGIILYTNGGVLDNDPPPLAKYVHVVNGVAIYAHIKEGSQIFKNRLRQSVQDDPDSCPRELYLDVLDEIVGVSSYTDSPIVFTKNHVYRLNGAYNEFGQGSVNYEDITKTIGCLSNSSIIQTRDGVFWAGNDGFYWTDGFKFQKISDSINIRYKQMVSNTNAPARIYGVYDPKESRIHWAVTYGSTSSDNDTLFSLDLRWGIRPASTFTTRSNDTSFSPTALTYYQGNLIRADRRGYVFKHNSNYTTDPKIDTTTAPSNWTTKAITPIYKSCVINFGIENMRKWVPKMLLTLENATNTSVQITSINDNTSVQKNLQEIRFRGNYLWGDPNPIWGADTPLWNYFNLIEEMRHFPAQSLRCSYKQIIITQSYSIIYNSDTLTTATPSLSLKTVTLDSGSFSWPADVVDYYIYFANDSYTKGYLITTRNSSSQLTYLDALNTSPSTSQKWVIKGYPKGEIINVLSYVMYFAPISSQSYKTWRTEQDSSGANA